MGEHERSPVSPVILVADHKWRDLPSMALLKVLLQDRYNIPAVVTSYHGLAAGLPLFRPRAIALTTLIGPREQKLARWARGAGAAVVVIPTEGILGSRESMAGMFRSPDFWEVCDLYLPWGPATADFSIQEGYLPKERVCLTGSGRFDFYRVPLRQLLLDRAVLERTFGIAPGRSLVTWATTFILATYHENKLRLEYSEKDLASRGLAGIQGFANLAELALREHQAKQLVLEWMRKTAVRFPQVDFLIKPHPYEAVEAYEQLIQRCRQDGVTNLHVCVDMYIGDILPHAAVHIHSRSTTGIESWALGIPSINLRPGGYSRFKGAEGGILPALDALDDNQEDVKGLHERLSYYISGGRVDESRESGRKTFLYDWFYLMDGQGGERQAQAIAELLTGRSLASVYAPKPAWVGVRPLFARAQYRMNRFLGRPFDEPWFESKGKVPEDFLGQRDKTVRQRDVAVWVQRIREVLAKPYQPS